MPRLNCAVYRERENAPAGQPGAPSTASGKLRTATAYTRGGAASSSNIRKFAFPSDVKTPLGQVNERRPPEGSSAPRCLACMQ
jgi:hypothetical protein